MIIENTEALKSWLTSCLSRICDADPAALAKYVLALVKKDKPENDLRDFCSDQLDVFLLKNTKVFVDLLFEALKTKSYLNSTTETPPAIDAKITSSPSIINTVVKTSPHPTEYTSINEAVKNVKKEIESQLKDPSNSDHSNKSRSSFRSNRRSKSRSRSPIRKSGRHRDRSRSREGDYNHKRLNSDDDDERSKSHSYPSKKAKFSKQGRNEYYSKSSEDYKRDDKRGYKYSKERDYELGDRNRSRSKSRSRSNSRDRRRSRSNSLVRSSRSRSRERVDQLDKVSVVKTDTIKQHSDHGDTDYRQKSLPSVVKPQFKSTANYSTKITKRCQDYDEKGYCMRGDFCPFDHGDDPISVEDVSVLNVDRANSKSPLPPPLPPLPPPLPPLPPPGYIPEPYNPEAPGMNMAPREHIPFWAAPPPHLPPPPIIPPPPPGMPNVIFNINEPPPSFHNPKHHRTRELIGVPTVGNIDSRHVVLKSRNKSEDKVPAESTENIYTHAAEKIKINNFSLSVVDNEDKKKGFDYNRLGPSPKKVSKFNNTRNTLEVRKIPKHLNTIAMLNNHFSKFGRIVNLQVNFEGDPEAALIQFMTHGEANSAYKSTDAVFNNRFIKVFWHNNDKFNKVLSDNSNKSLAIQSELKSHDKAVDKRITTSIDEATQSNDLSKHNIERTERSVVYSTKPNFTRTVFNPASMKKNNVPNPAVASVRKPKEEQRKDTLQKRFELHKKKQELLNSQIGNQRSILEKLSKCKSDKERELLKKMIQALNEKVSILQSEVKKDSEELKVLIKSSSSKSPVSKTEAEKELLDAEMDLYNKQHAGDDTADLLSRVLELKQKAKALGLIDASPLGPAKMTLWRGRGRFMSRGLYSNVSARAIDRRKSLTLNNREELPKSALPVTEIVKMDEPDSSFNDLVDSVLDVEPDDEEEEASEARSWRH